MFIWSLDLLQYILALWIYRYFLFISSMYRRIIVEERRKSVGKRFHKSYSYTFNFTYASFFKLILLDCSLINILYTYIFKHSRLPYIRLLFLITEMEETMPENFKLS